MAAKNAPKAEPKADALDKPANIPAATDFSTSGAPVQVTDFDPSHPAVDNDPRKDSTLKQNQIDFNDPDLSEEEAVAKNLGYSAPKASSEG